MDQRQTSRAVETMTACRPTGSSPRERMGEAARRHADDADRRRGAAAAVPQRSDLASTRWSAIYLPLSRLLSLYVAATQGLFKATQRFLLAENEGKVPYIIGVAGSVAVGKSTTARVLKALLARWPNTPEGRPRHHRRLPAAQRRADAARV